MIPYSRQTISDDDIDAVIEVLRSEFLTQGSVVPAFEEAVRNYCDSNYGVAVNSGTSALHLACLCLDVGPGDWVWTSAITYVASANCARYCGADVDFVDIEMGTRNISVSALKNKLEQAEAKGVLPKVLIPVHFGGHTCDMEEIAELGNHFGFRIIEDATHALGATYKDTGVGSGTYSDITIFSFHAIKLITSGEGGMAMSNDEALAKRMRRLRSHGIDNYREIYGTWGYDLKELGFNYRLTDIQAALGLSQLKQVNKFVQRRTELAGRYNDLLVDLPVHLPLVKEGNYPAWHLYVVNLDSGRSQKNRTEVFSDMRDAGIGVNLHYMPVYKHTYYHALYGENLTCPQAEDYYDSALTLPLHPALP